MNSSTMSEIFGKNYSMILNLSGVIAILCGMIIGKIVHNYWVHHSRLMKAAESFPGPRPIPFLGNILDFILNHQNMMDALVAICKEYPLNRVWLGPLLIINITTPEDIEAPSRPDITILKKFNIENNNEYVIQIVIKNPKVNKKSFIYKLIEPAVTDSLMNGHGPKLRAHRKLIIPIVNGEHLIDYMKVFNKQFHRCVDTLAEKVNSGEFDIYCEAEYCIADIAFEVLFGVPGIAQDSGDLTFAHAVTESLEILFHRANTPWLHPRFLFNLSKSGRTWNKHAKYVFDFLLKIVNDKKQLYEALARGESRIQKPQLSILDLLIENVLVTNAMSDREIATEALALFIGFFDTITGLFAFLMLMLAMHQKAQKKVRQEVMAVLGSNVNVLKEHIDELKYTDMAIRETIRLFPIGPILSREVTDDLKLVNHTVPKGATLTMIPLVTHRSEKQWDKPNAFIPERFLPENSKNRHPFAFIPFSGGSRSCPGSKFGMTCLKVLAAQFIRKYQATTTMKFDDIKLKQDLSIRSANGYRISIKKIV